MRRRTLESIVHSHVYCGKRRSDFLQLAFFALAAAGEAGELANFVKKKWRGDRKFKGKAGLAAWNLKVDEEIVDLANYVFMMADHRRIQLRARMRKKLLEVEARDDDWNKPKEHKDTRARVRKKKRSAKLSSSEKVNARRR